MDLVNLNSSTGARLAELLQGSYRPKEIVELKQKIESETRVAEVRYSATGQVDQDLIKKIVSMKIELDSLSLLWAEGKIS